MNTTNPEVLQESRKKISEAIALFLSDRIWQPDKKRQLSEEQLQQQISSMAGDHLAIWDLALQGKWREVEFEIYPSEDSRRTREYLGVHHARLKDPRASGDYLWFARIYFPAPLMLDLLLESRVKLPSAGEANPGDMLDWSTSADKKMKELMAGEWGAWFTRLASEYLLTVTDEHLDLGPLLKPPPESAEDVLQAVEKSRLLPAEAEVESPFPDFQKPEPEPGDWLGRLELGIECSEAGRTEEAIELFEEAARIGPDTAEGFYDLGYCFNLVDRPKDAAAAFKKALAIDGDYADARLGLAVSLEALGRIQEAKDCYDYIINTSPDDATAHSRLGVCYQELGRWEDSIRELETAIELEPDNFFHHALLSSSYEEVGRTADALQALHKAHELDPTDSETSAMLAWHYLDMEDLEQGEKYLTTALEHDPDNTYLLKAFARLCAECERDRVDEEVGTLEKVLALEPDSTEAHRMLAEVFIREGMTEEALQQIKVLSLMDETEAQKMHDMLKRCNKSVE
jgi:tetratricopeptide (TPR) repeat protein